MAQQGAEMDVNPFTSLNFSEAEANEKQVLDDFLSDTVSAKPEEVTKITKEKEEKQKVEKSVGKSKEELAKEAQDLLDAALTEEEEEEEVVVTPKGKKKVETAALKEDEEVVEENDNTFSIISKNLFDMGVFSKDEEEEDIEIDTPEKFLNRFTYETDKKSNEKIQNFLGKFGEGYQKAFEAIYVNGVDPKEYFTAYNEIADLAELDLKLESNQEAIVKQELQQRGFNPEQIRIKLEKIKNYGDLEEEATLSHSILLKNQASKLAEKEERSKAVQSQQIAVKQQFVNSVTKTLEEKLIKKEFDGIPLNPKVAQELQDYLITDKWRTPQGESLTDFDKDILDLKRPENHQLKVKYALLLQTLKKDPTLQTIQKVGVTKETNKLFNGLTVKKDKSGVKEQKSNFASYL